MSLKKIKFEDKNNDWKIWQKNSGVERSIKRIKKTLPEMECSKQLAKIVKKIYKSNDRILDFGCAAGHYYYSLSKIDKNIKYWGFDPTKDYINFAKKHFRKNRNTTFDVQSLFSMSKKYRKNIQKCGIRYIS